jgi:flagellar biosynthesis/type III secretory pathway ATPase
VLQNIASVTTCVRQDETNSRWLREVLGQIVNAVNKKTDSDNQQVSTATVMPTQQMPPANFKSRILKTRVNTHTQKVIQWSSSVQIKGDINV